MKKVIITGAAGFVGSAVVKKLLSQGIEVLAIDILDNFNPMQNNADSSFKYKKCDISNLVEFKAILNGYPADTFYHFAWVGSAGPLRESSERQVANALLTVDMLKLAKELKCKKFVCAGTIMEYEVTSLTYGQHVNPQMSHIYGAGKQLAHSLCKSTANSIGIDLIWAYITNAYGVGEKSPRLINTTIRKILSGQQLLFSSGTQNYDFVYIDDVAQAFYLLGEKGIHNCGYIIGSGEATSLRNFLERLIRICDKDAVVNFGEMPFTGADIPLEVFSIRQIQEDVDFVPQVSFEEGIRRTFEWIKELNNG